MHGPCATCKLHGRFHVHFIEMCEKFLSRNNAVPRQAAVVSAPFIKRSQGSSTWCTDCGTQLKFKIDKYGRDRVVEFMWKAALSQLHEH